MIFFSSEGKRKVPFCKTKQRLCYFDHKKHLKSYRCIGPRSWIGRFPFHVAYRAGTRPHRNHHWVGLPFPFHVWERERVRVICYLVNASHQKIVEKCHPKTPCKTMEIEEKWQKIFLKLLPTHRSSASFRSPSYVPRLVPSSGNSSLPSSDMVTLATQKVIR